MIKLGDQEIKVQYHGLAIKDGEVEISVYMIRLPNYVFNTSISGIPVDPTVDIPTSGFMDQLASEVFKEYPGASVVHVQEHGGWWLEFAVINGRMRVIGTANDRARFPEEVAELREFFLKAKRNIVDLGTAKIKLTPSW